MKTAVTVVITYQAQPGHGAIALRELTQLIRTVVATETECLSICLHQDPIDETRFLLYERWNSKAAYEGPHMETPHLLAFKRRAASVFAGPPDIAFWQLAHDAERT